MSVRVSGVDAVTDPGDTVADPDPSGALVTFTVGEAARADDVPAAVDFSATANVEVPVVLGDSAELEPPPEP